MRPVGFDSETIRGKPMTLQFYTDRKQSIVAVTEDNAEKKFFILLEDYSTNDNILTVVFGHHLAFDMLSAFPNRMGEFSDGYFEFSSHGWFLTGVYGRPTFCKCSKGRRRVLIVDTGRFARAGTSLAEISASYTPHLPKLRMPEGLGQKRFSVRDPAFASYAIRDAEIAYEFGKIIIAWHERYDVPMSLSGPHFAAQVFRRHYVTDPIPLPPRALSYAAIRAYHGGLQRSAYAPGFFPDVDAVDIVSAYPHAMHEAPSFTNPRCYRPYKSSAGGAVPPWGVYRVTGFVKPGNPYVCIFDEHFRAVEGDFDTNATGFEINAFLKLRQGNIRSVRGYYYDVEKDKAFAPMRSYVENFFKMKSESKVKVERESAKLLLNSLYGKFIQTRVEMEPYYDIKNDEFVPHTELRAGGLFNPFIAACITGHTRSRLCTLEHTYSAVHSATDGIIAPAKNTRSIRTHADGSLGSLSIESSGDALIVRPKLYVIYAESTKLQDRVTEKPLKSNYIRGAKSYIQKYALHGFRGRITDLENMLQSGLNEYEYMHVVGLKESLRSTQDWRANDFIERTGVLHVDLP